MMPYLAVGVIVTGIVVWMFFTQRVLALLDETINNAMSQIGIHLSNRWDALSVLLDLIKDCVTCEDQVLSQTIQARRPVTAKSAVWDAAAQDNILAQALGRILTIAEQYPDLKANQSYQKTMDNINQYEGMIRQSRLLYNDSVTKLNRRIRLFPVSVLAKIFGFVKRDYLELRE